MVLIVSGLPRSGTSMMLHMLLAGGVPVLYDNIRSADVDNPDGYYEYSPVRHSARDVSWVDKAEGKAVKVIYRLLRYLPGQHDYHVIYMQRSIGETITSQNRMLERLGIDAGISWDDNAWAERLDEESRCACQWIASRPNMRLHIADYNRLMADPVSELESLVAFLPIPADAAAMRAVINPRLYRHRTG